jgi:hypothetical protein
MKALAPATTDATETFGPDEDRLDQRLKMGNDPNVRVHVPVPPRLASDRVVDLLQVSDAKLDPA